MRGATPPRSTSDDACFEDPADLSEDWPYCECGEDPYEEEAASNICSSCGKLLS